MLRRWLLLVAACGLVFSLLPRMAEAGAAADVVPAEIAAVAAGFANALAEGKPQVAYDYLSSRSRAATSAAQWQQAYARRPTPRKPPALTLLRALAGSQTTKVGEMLIRSEEAFIAVHGSVEVPQQFVLVRESGGWKVDLAESDQLNGREAATTFLEAVRAEAEAGPRVRTQEVSLPLLRVLLSPEATNYRVTAGQLEGARARVTVSAEIPVNLVLRATRVGPGWMVDQARPVLPIDSSSPEPLKQAVALADKMTCEEQLTQLARAVQMYAAASDDMLPDPAGWLSQIRPYLPPSAQLHCPRDPVPGVSYAMNRNLAGKRLHQIANPAVTVLFFESALHGDNPSDAGESWLSKAYRHSEGNLVAYADGSVRAVMHKPSFAVKEGPSPPRPVSAPRRPVPLPGARPRLGPSPAPQ